MRTETPMLAKMAAYALHSQPPSQDGHVTGIVSALDVLRWLALKAGYLVPPESRRAEGTE
jgi:hypothetical protein